MKQRRKFLQMLDVRVRHSLTGHKLTASSRLSRVHSIESLAAEHSAFRAFAPAEAAPETSSL